MVTALKPITVVVWATGVVTAIIAAAWLTGRMVSWAGGLGLLDHPNARSSHVRPTPRGGGLAIVVVVTVAAALVAILRPEAAWSIAAVLLPGLAVAGVSWCDDVRPLPSRLRLGVHLLAAIATTIGLGDISVVNAGSHLTVDLGGSGFAVSVLWIVGMTNAFNFMDGVDGIAGITAVIAGAVIAAAAAFLGCAATTTIAAALAASATGFLAYNWQPARIFMGDVGSAWCGFLIATLPLLEGERASRQLLPLVAVVMWPFIFDTAYTLVRRLIKRENVFEAHRGHLYQRLTIAGWSHASVAAFYGLLAAALGGWALGVAWRGGSLAAELTLVSMMALVAIFLPLFVHCREAGASCRSAS